MRVYAPDLKHRAHPPWTHQIQQLHHPVPSISRSPIPFWHPHLQFDDPAFLGRMFCIKFLLRSTDTEIQSYPSVTRDFQSITSCLCNRWSSLICFDELPCSEFASLNSAPSVSSSLWVYYGTGMWLFFCRGHDQTWTGRVSHGRKKINRGDVSRPCLIMHASSWLCHWSFFLQFCLRNVLFRLTSIKWQKMKSWEVFRN